jgi:hypothetical protein
MKTIVFLSAALMLTISCQKSQDLPSSSAGIAETSNILINKTSKAAADAFHNTGHNEVKRVTVDFSGFSSVPNYSWTLTFKSTERHGETYIFRGDSARGYIQTEEMVQGGYEVTLDAKSSVNESLIFTIFTKKDNRSLSNDLDLELGYNQTTKTTAIQELASYYMSAASGR